MSSPDGCISFVLRFELGGLAVICIVVIGSSCKDFPTAFSPALVDGGVQVVLRADLRVWDWGTGGDFDSGGLRDDLQAVSAVWERSVFQVDVMAAVSSVARVEDMFRHVQ